MIVVGGGINGAGIAAEAVNRRLSVGLYEAKDFACATSSASSKLIHGGLRYLEYGEFRLVKEALNEREILLTKAAHLIKPMRFRMPHLPHLRAKWQIKAGLFLYDHLAKRCLLAPSLQLKVTPADGLSKHIDYVFEYSDCWIDDSRLVIENLKLAQCHGAEVRNYCRVTKAERVDQLWRVTLFDQRTGCEHIRYCRVLVNATGPWAAEFLNQSTPESSPHTMRLIKGSHLIVPRIYPDEHAYVLQNQDKRIVFVIPYLDRFSMIGTTDIPFDGDPYQAMTSEDEINYLLSVTNQFFNRQLTPDDVIDHFSGVRPLFNDGEGESVSAQAVSRDYDLALQTSADNPPLLTVFGGKLTTYRKLSLNVLESLAPYFPNAYTEKKDPPLLGSQGYQKEVLLHQLASQLPYLSSQTRQRLVDQYGTEVWNVVKDAQSSDRTIVADLYPFELDYLVTHEWAVTVEDIVKRRTKLHFDCDSQALAALASALIEGQRSQNIPPSI
ncbi:glycerol-3-phosphate dehydrogenase [Vibrio ichthyoenteri ATCC 700023]|uniref:Glycerol-3-phosphate dehydrogenase n=2 Tax=Vibrio ichthyoenteri TaxID=142461 RepID=F9RXK5_9VIBR|nr:glycerol-3-phosphate dehydrogenase [Vibrio ichthyoenteri ATCC 700023]